MAQAHGVIMSNYKVLIPLSLCLDGVGRAPWRVESFGPNPDWMILSHRANASRMQAAEDPLTPLRRG